MSSKRRLRAKSCTGKRKFKSVEHANRFLAHLPPDITRGIEGYQCLFCQHAHTGHMSIHRPGSRQRLAEAAWKPR